MRWTAATLATGRGLHAASLHCLHHRRYQARCDTATARFFVLLARREQRQQQLLLLLLLLLPLQLQVV